MTSRFSTLGISAILLLGLSGCGTLAADQETLIPVSADELPSTSTVGAISIPEAERGAPLEFSGTTLDGGSLTTEEFLGRPTVINFWASWCAPCRDELPELATAFKDLSEGGIQFLGVNVEDAPEAAEAFSESIPYPSIRDDSGAFLAAVPDVPPSALPITLILDDQGRIGARIIGPTTSQALTQLVENLETP